MPLILAIEPDKRQGSQLATVVKELHAELVHRTTVADALEALHGRVPDLVLTTSLISPRDDAALAAHLRELGPAAAHVQTVTIPVLGTAAPQRARGGMLAALRREKPQASVTDGCAPEVFAEQVRQYLTTAEHQKANVSTRAAIEPDVVDAAPVEAEFVASEPESLTPEPEIVAAEPEFIAPEPVVFEAAAVELAPAPVVDEVTEPESIAAEPEVVADEAPEPVVFETPIAAAAPEADVEIAEPDEFMADEPMGLPLSQLLQLVSDAAPASETPVVEALFGESPVVESSVVESLAVEATAFEAPVVEELFAAPVADPVAEPVAEPVAAVASEWTSEEDWAPEPVPDPVLEPEAHIELEVAPQPDAQVTGNFGDLYADPMAAQALDELSRQPPMASVAEGVPGEPPVPVVEMHRFQSLDSIASELAAGPSPRYESLDDIASLFAVTPTASGQPATSPFASLFAEPEPAAPTAAPIDVPGIDPNLFAATPAMSSTAFDEPLTIDVPGVATDLFAAAPEPVVDELTFDDLFIDEPAVAELVVERVAEPMAAEPVMETAPEPVFEDVAEPVVALEPIVEPEPIGELEPIIAFEAVVFDAPAAEPEPVAAAAASDFDEEISLDVDAFKFTPPEPAAPAEPERFSFTLVEGFGDALSDFEVPTVAAVAADLGVGEHPPLDPYASQSALALATPRGETAEPKGAPSLDDEALSLIGAAARKLGLDALVIEEFERGMSAPKQKKLKKKVHVGATPVPAAPSAPAKGGVKRPVQDEWGMFDPEQCGFAAIEDEEGGKPRSTTGTRVRVISY